MIKEMYGLHFPINNKGSFIFTQDNTHYGFCFTSCGVLAWMKNSSMGPASGINFMSHHTISRHYHWTTSSTLRGWNPRKSCTFKILVFTDSVWVDCTCKTLSWWGLKEGNVLFNDALNTFYLRLYGIRHMVKDHSDNERGNLLPPHGPLFPISSMGSFICIIPQTG